MNQSGRAHLSLSDFARFSQLTRQLYLQVAPFIKQEIQSYGNPIK
jgi:hypothetical protein